MDRAPAGLRSRELGAHTRLICRAGERDVVDHVLLATDESTPPTREKQVAHIHADRGVSGVAYQGSASVLPTGLRVLPALSGAPSSLVIVQRPTVASAPAR